MTDPAAPDLAIVGLKPCPFCGHTEHLFAEPDEMGSGGQWVPPVHVGCSQQHGCGVSVVRETEAEAVAAWNTRADSPEAAQCIEMLVAALEVFARCPTHGKHGGAFVIASASFGDMRKGESAPREAYWHKSDFDKARAALAKVRGR